MQISQSFISQNVQSRFVGYHLSFKKNGEYIVIYVRDAGFLMLFYFTRCFRKTEKKLFHFKNGHFPFFQFSFQLHRMTSHSCTPALAHLHRPPFCFVCLRACWPLAGAERSDSRLFFKGCFAPPDAPKRCGVELLCHGGPSRRSDLL